MRWCKVKKILLIVSVLITACICLVSCELVSPQPSKGTLHVVSIGDNFENQSEYTTLYYCENDADAICQVFDYLGKKAGMETDIHDCTEGRLEGFIATLEEVRLNTSDDDLTVIFISTHGSNTVRRRASYYDDIDDNAYFYLEKTDDSVGKVSDSELVEYAHRFKGKVLILADFCYSGSLVTQDNFTYNRANYSGSSALSILFDRAPATGSDKVFAFSASTYYEASYSPFSDYPFSEFTKYFLKGLGLARYYPDNKSIVMSSEIPVLRNKKIILSDIYRYVYKITTNSSVVGGHTQTPQINTGATDLILFSF